jgi:hypothetical protein
MFFWEEEGVFFFGVLKFELRASLVLGRQSTTNTLEGGVLKTGSHYAAQADLELTILLSLLPKCWDC